MPNVTNEEIEAVRSLVSEMRVICITKNDRTDPLREYLNTFPFQEGEYNLTESLKIGTRYEDAAVVKRYVKGHGQVLVLVDVKPELEYDEEKYVIAQVLEQLSKLISDLDMEYQTVLGMDDKLRETQRLFRLSVRNAGLLIRKGTQKQIVMEAVLKDENGEFFDRVVVKISKRYGKAVLEYAEIHGFAP
ncbi:hypothetical protein HK098_003436 [Nowakowskiella sp. JEL0407]|nr:hypothetical protein HK098_003436 [Nowakowskiella sp. JEL0407]